jgi:hypothetical protein
MINNFLSGGDQLSNYAVSVPAKCVTANYTYYEPDVDLFFNTD